MTAAERLGVLLRVAETERSGQSFDQACNSENVPPATIRKWRKRYADGGIAALEEGKSSGRPALVELTEEERGALQRRYLATNVAKCAGSKTRAARRLAQDPNSPLREDTRKAILLRADGEPRASKHDITKSIRRAMDVPKHLFLRHRDARAAELAGSYCPGRLRRTRDLSRRLWAGEVLSVDDGTQNNAFWVPWPWGGDPCADKFGVKLGRYQTLMFCDHGSNYSPTREVVVRPQQSYRRSDQTACVYRLLRDVVVPVELVLEGNWDVNEDVLELCRLNGVTPVSARGRPHQKLVELYWNNLWTEISHVDGHVGRFRGEMREETDLYLRCRQGREDPRDHYCSLPQFLNALDRSIVNLNHDRVESKLYGKWVPAERWAADEEHFPKVTMDAAQEWRMAPVRKVRTVRAGVVTVRAMSPLGEAQEYVFSSRDLWRFDGHKVRVYFDPWEALPRACLVAARDWQDWRAGDVIERHAHMVGTIPVLTRGEAGWAVEMSAGPAEALKRAQRASVRTEYAKIAPGRGVAESVVRSPDGLSATAIELDSKSILRGESGSPGFPPSQDVVAHHHASLPDRRASTFGGRRRPEATAEEVERLERELGVELMVR